jgi:hypothetical protein
VRKTASANQSDESCRASVWTGGRKKKLNASMLATDTAIADGSPKKMATGKTANR